MDKGKKHVFVIGNAFDFTLHGLHVINILKNLKSKGFVITKTSVMTAYRKARQLGGDVTGSKQLGVFALVMFDQFFEEGDY